MTNKVEWQEVSKNREWRMKFNGGNYGSVFRVDGNKYQWFANGKTGTSGSFAKAKSAVEEEATFGS